MKKRIYVSFFLLVSLLFMVFTIGSRQVQAEGSVSTKGQIRLTRPSTEPSSTDSDTSSSTTKSSGVASSESNRDQSTIGGNTTKPQGRYPSTGELVRTSLSVSGALLLLVGVTLYRWHKKKQAQQGGEEL